MTARVAVVTADYGSSWSEQHVVLRRIGGALACVADVDVLVAGASNRSNGADGALHMIGFPGVPPDADRLLALRRALLGPQPADHATRCSCTADLQRCLAAELPRSAQHAFLVAGGGWSPELFENLAAGTYDLVVFAGCLTASTYWGMDALADGARCVVVPFANDDALLAAPVVGDVLARADLVLTTTPWEADVLRGRWRGIDGDRIVPVGFAVNVNDLAKRGPPFGFDGRATVVVARDWNLEWPSELLLRWCAALCDHLGPDANVRLVGPGTQRLPRRLRAEFAASRADVWRWMAHGVAVLDAEPQRLLGREVLEAMLFATPVIVAADGGATRFHAEEGDGGLWYRTFQELEACVRTLLDGDVRRDLGSRGEAYARDHYGDPAGFIRRVNDAVETLL